MSTQTLDDFRSKTLTELARISNEAATVRARMPQHRPCPDEAPCTFCAKILAAHVSLNDHIEQLEAAS